MHSSRFPCWLCGRSTDGADTYVICAECADDLDHRSGDPVPHARFPSPIDAVETSEPSSSPAIPLSPDEIEARIRALLNDW